jgi:hypothetical protein
MGRIGATRPALPVDPTFEPKFDHGTAGLAERVSVENKPTA